MPNPTRNAPYVNIGPPSGNACVDRLRIGEELVAPASFVDGVTVLGSGADGDPLRTAPGGGLPDVVDDAGVSVTVGVPLVLPTGTAEDGGLLQVTGGIATQTKQVLLQQTNANHTAYEAINLVAFQQATFDTAAGPAKAVAGDFEVTSARIAGVEQLTNVAVQAIATGGDVNYSFLSTAGTMRNDGGAVLGGSLVVGPEAPAEDYPFYLSTVNTQSQNMVVVTKGDNIIPTGTDERQAINAFVQGSVNTSASTSGSVNAMGLQANVSCVRSAGAAPLNNIAVQANASGGQQNYSWLSTFGVMRNDGQCVFGNVQADNIVATAQVTTEALDVGAGGGVFNLRKNGTIGGSVADLLALNSSITTFLTLLGATTNGTAVILKATTAGGHSYSVGSIPDASFLPTGFTIYDGTSGYEALHIENSMAGPGKVVVMGNVAIGGAAAPTISSGAGVPVAAAPTGSLYMRTDGGAGTSLYVKEPAAWVPK